MCADRHTADLFIATLHTPILHENEVKCVQFIREIHLEQGWQKQVLGFVLEKKLKSGFSFRFLNFHNFFPRKTVSLSCFSS